MNFADIEINRTEVPQSELNIDVRTRTNLFAWNGQFSPQFVEAELSKYATESMLVVDPFLGSGTVVYECIRKGISAYGTELNVSAYYMAKTYELSQLNLDARWELISSIDGIILPLTEKCLENIISESTANENVRVRDVLSTLIVLIDIDNKETTTELINDKWQSLKDTINNLPYCTKKITVDNGDARCLRLKNDSADLILTSPPYINVFNYHQKYRASVELLGYNVLSIAKSEFGSNRKHRGNRIYTVIQYCIDISLSLKEANRVCKLNARMIYVVGRESTVLGYSFCNSELVYKLGVEVFGFDFLLRQERVFKNRYGQMIYEDIIHFKNIESVNLTDESIISSARNIAVDMLKTKLTIDNKNIYLLEDAICQAKKIKQSEVNNG